MRIELLTSEMAAGHEAALCRLRRDAVENGASIGFVLPLPAESRSSPPIRTVPWSRTRSIVSG
jgi:hypothetical protein